MENTSRSEQVSRRKILQAGGACLATATAGCTVTTAARSPARAEPPHANPNLSPLAQDFVGVAVRTSRVERILYSFSDDHLGGSSIRASAEMLLGRRVSLWFCALLQ